MVKNDPNLGMLWSYVDAKVMKSNGEITDRHFARRPDKTYYLQNDDEDDIVSAGHHQNDFYSYEFAFPRKTRDSKDIELEIGKAYNMLLVVGNTLEHYGIFTLDKAHANHDHSKNNKDHADVWASNETTLRIGYSPDKDIFGNPGNISLTFFDSGSRPDLHHNHFH